MLFIKLVSPFKMSILIKIINGFTSLPGDTPITFEQNCVLPVPTKLHQLVFPPKNDVSTRIFNVNVFQKIPHKYLGVLIMWFSGQLHCNKIIRSHLTDFWTISLKQNVHQVKNYNHENLKLNWEIGCKVTLTFCVLTTCQASSVESSIKKK